MRNAFVVSAVGVLMLSCGGTPGGGTTVTTANKLRAVQATGGVAGGKGKLRLTFENPLAADTSVTIKSSAPTIADAAATLSAPKGSVLADFEYDAKLIGSTVFYATLGEDTRSTNATVVDKFGQAVGPYAPWIVGVAITRKCRLKCLGRSSQHDD